MELQEVSLYSRQLLIEFLDYEELELSGLGKKTLSCSLLDFVI